jgi:hypothetical protein
MQKYHAVAEIICSGVFATNLGFCPLYFVRRIVL